MIPRLSFYLLLLSFTTILASCSTNDDNPIPEDVQLETQIGADSCSNVVIVEGYAYAACGNVLEVVNLSNQAREVLQIPSDDISFDVSNGHLFVQSGNRIQALSLQDPSLPAVIASSTTNFGLFSGIDVANGLVVVSGGTSNSNTQVYRFSNSAFTLTTNGIPAVDGVTGNPDVHLTETANGARAFYSQDLGAVANWGIQIVDFNTSGVVQNTEDVIVLSPQRFSGGFSTVSPANFPVESEFLNNTLYVAHFAVNGLEVIDLSTPIPSRSVVNLGYTPVNVTTDGTQLFTVGTTSKTISILNPNTNTVEQRVVNDIVQARGIAVSQDYIVIADRSRGVIVVNR